MNVDRLKKILSIQSTTYKQWRMFAHVVREIKGIEDCSLYVDGGNIYVTKGKAGNYPCVVAHLDTVHAIVSDLYVLEVGKKLTGFNRHEITQTGIGGDDKVGIFIALECLRLFDNIKVVFFVNEEFGCVGSYEADIDFFENCGFVLQCDRKGKTDFVTEAGGVTLSNKSFQKAIRSIITEHGYSFYRHGGMTDVMALKEIGIGLCMANIGCGYYNPHCANEYVDIDDVENCLEMVQSIIWILQGKIFEHKYFYVPPVKAVKYEPLKWKDFEADKKGFKR